MLSSVLTGARIVFLMIYMFWWNFFEWVVCSILIASVYMCYRCSQYLKYYLIFEFAPLWFISLLLNQFLTPILNQINSGRHGWTDSRCDPRGMDSQGQTLQVREKRKTYERTLKIHPENSRDEQLPLTVKMMICLHGADESENLSFATTVDVSACGGA